MNRKRTDRKPRTRLGGEITTGLQSVASEAELEAILTAKIQAGGWKVTPASAAYLEGLRDGQRRDVA